MATILAPENVISLYRGSSKTLVLHVTEVESGAIVRLTGATLYFTVRKTLDADAPLLFKTSTQVLQIAITDALAGIAEIYIQPSDTLALNPGLYVYDVWVQLASGAIYIVIEPSVFEVKKGVTRFTP